MSGRKDQIIILAGDIGGTKTNLGLFRQEKSRPLPGPVETYLSREAPGLEVLIERFLKRHAAPIYGACFGIAGPVSGGRCKTTNLPWVVSESSIKRHFHWERVSLINDLAATALAIPWLRNSERIPLNRAKAIQVGSIGLVAPGTGLGMAMLIRGPDNSYIPVSSEGGHRDFAPANEEEVELWRYLRRRWGHVSLERLLSGSGLFHIYSWLKETGRYREPGWLARAIAGDDPAKVISAAAMEQGQPMCRRVLVLFTSILGAAAGDLALTGMTTGGIYLGGGIPPKILPHLKKGDFMKAFVNKGRFRDWMSQIPVRVIMNDRAALQGAAYGALRQIVGDG